MLFQSALWDILVITVLPPASFHRLEPHVKENVTAQLKGAIINTGV
jgi:hypothetical protein